MSFLHLNVANEWPFFDRHAIDIGAAGALRLAPATPASLAKRGVFVGGPFAAPDDRRDWYRVRVQAPLRPPGTHVQLFTFGADGGSAPFVDPAGDEPFADPAWVAAPRDQLDWLLPSASARQLWIGGVLRGDGVVTPEIEQIRVTLGRDTYLAHLPALYGRDDQARDFIERFLSLNESVLGGLEDAIGDLPFLFDAGASPDESPSWLRWLSSWLAFEPNEAWPTADFRRFLAEAFELYAWRGTPSGLRRYIKMYAGLEARIIEPGLETARWGLGETSSLGFTTRLAPGSPEGAVLDRTAVVDEAPLTSPSDDEAPLSAELAHTFCVEVYCGELTRPGALDDAKTIIDREKPAHTEYHLRVIEPRLRVGVQAQVGIDAIVGGMGGYKLGAPLGSGALPPAAQPCEHREE